MENFSLEKLVDLYENTTKKDVEYQDCKEYIKNTIYPVNTTNGSPNYCMFDNGKLVMMDDKAFTKMFLNRFPNQLKKWFTTSPDIKYFKTICEPHNDKIVDLKKMTLNCAVKIKAKYQKYETFSQKTKTEVERMLYHILHVLCNDDKNQYDYFLKLLKNMCLGRKNNVACVISGISQGTGKSTIVDFLRDHVLGLEASCEGSPSTVEKFNFDMFSKYMISFEEAERIFKHNATASSTFKNWITNDFITYEAKNKSMFTASNHHTIFLTANDINFNPDGNGRRYFIMDVSPKMKGKEDYFIQLKECDNDICGDAFFSYLIDNVVVEDKFIADLKMPTTQNKVAEIADKLSKPLLFIKQEYLLKKVGIRDKVSCLCKSYNSCGKYHQMGDKKFFTILKETSLCNYMKRIDGGYNGIDISFDDLLREYRNNYYLTEFDEDELLDNNEPDTIDYKDLYQKAKKEIEELKSKLAKFEMSVVQKPQPQEEQVVDEEDELEQLEREITSIQPTKQKTIVIDDDDEVVVSSKSRVYQNDSMFLADLISTQNKFETKSKGLTLLI